jgi:hypothetical protein
MIDQAIYNTHSNVVNIIESTDAYDAQGNVVELDMTLVNAEVTKLQAAYDAKAYQRTRSLEYPSIQDQLDMQYWDSVNGTTTWATAIAKVKTDNPKP